MIQNMFLGRPEIIQILSVLLRFLLSFSLCLMRRTGVGLGLGLGLGSYCLTSCTYSDDSEYVPGKTGDYPNTFRIASLSSLILALSDGAYGFGFGFGFGLRFRDGLGM